MGHAVFDLLDVPLFGRPEDDADQFAAHVLIQIGKNDAHRLIEGAAYMYKDYVKNPTITVPVTAFADVHGAPMQRLYNLLCLAYGANSDEFSDVVDKGYLPKSRAPACKMEMAGGRLRVSQTDLSLPRPGTAQRRAEQVMGAICPCPATAEDRSAVARAAAARRRGRATQAAATDDALINETPSRSCGWPAPVQAALKIGESCEMFSAGLAIAMAVQCHGRQIRSLKPARIPRSSARAGDKRPCTLQANRGQHHHRLRGAEPISVARRRGLHRYRRPRAGDALSFAPLLPPRMPPKDEQ
jgi:hypothetical protein